VSLHGFLVVEVAVLLLLYGFSIILTHSYFPLLATFRFHFHFRFRYSDPNGQALLEDWRDKKHLKILNLLYDLTPCEMLSMVITEFGIIPATSVPVILREFHAEFDGS
jgi:translation initiation factor 2B subunit (eIF-2B alpha/beta/delta family)